MGYVILLWHSLSLPYNYFTYIASYVAYELHFFVISHFGFEGKTSVVIAPAPNHCLPVYFAYNTDTLEKYNYRFR